MKISPLRRDRRTSSSGVVGRARLDRRTSSVARRARSGDIAVIDHADLDRASASALVQAGVAGVVNIAPSVTGRYPNLGPGVLLEAGVPLVDGVGADAFAAINEGDLLRIDGDAVYRDDDVVAAGQRQTSETLSRDLDASRAGMASQMDAFSANAMEHLRHERELLLDGEGLPDLSSQVKGRPVVVVVRAHDYESDLRGLATFVKERHPVLVGVGAGADVLVEAGYTPDVIVGPTEEVSDAVLRSGATLVAQTTRDGRVHDADRFDRLGLEFHSVATEGTAEDAALLLAHHNGAALIVSVGSHADLVELLDKGRTGMASSFLTRTTVGASLVDAKAVARLYSHRVRAWMVLVGLLVAVVAVCAAIATTPVGQEWFDQVITWVEQTYDGAKGLVS